MKKQLLSLFLLSGMIFTAMAQTSIAPGNLMFLGFQSGQLGATDPDRFAFILLQDVDSGTVVSFTDNAVIGQSPLVLCTNEGVVSWTSTSNLPAGSIVRISADTTTSNGLVSGSLSFSQSGDQILVFQVNTNPDTVFIGGFSSTGWLTSCSAGCGNTSGNNSATCLPFGLESQVNVMDFTSEVNNSYFNLALLTGSPGDIRAALLNSENWTRSDSIQTWPDWAVNVTASNPEIIRKSTLYPNPAQEWIQIDNQESGCLSFFDLHGKICKQQILIKGQQRISVQDLREGWYYMTRPGCNVPELLRIQRN